MSRMRGLEENRGAGEVGDGCLQAGSGLGREKCRW